jgi:hypothetical protein
VAYGSLNTVDSTASGSSATGGIGGVGDAGVNGGNGGSDSTPVFNYAGTINGSAATGAIADALSPSATFTYVVNSTADTDTEGTLRGALAAAATTAGIIAFDNTVFLASNTTAQNTITLGSSLEIPPNTTIQGLTVGSGATLRNLVTISGGGSTSNFSMFTVSSGVTGAVLSNLNIANGYTKSQGGAINTAGNLTITNSTFSTNYAAGYLGSGNGGGAIYTTGGLLAISGSTFSGNTGYPGGVMTINSDVMISNSTFTGNISATPYAGTVMFINSGTVTIADSTISGNSSSGTDAIYNYGTLNLTNSIIAGNTSGNCGSSGSTSCPTNGANGNIVGSTISLAPLGSYGGPTQTMIPLPGSTAICAGLASNIASGVTTDQRGYPNTNATYPGYSAGNPCVDAGAVQTNYALEFSQQPSTTDVGVAMSPAPTVALNESGSSFTASVNAISLTLTGNGALGGSSATTSAGTATYSNLTISAAGMGDTLMANLPLSSAVSTPLSVTSNSFNIVAQVTATLVVSSASLTQNHVISPFTPVSGSGGTGTLTYSVTPALPAGLSFSTSTGAVSGTPTVASSATSYTVTVTDSLGLTASANFTLSISGPVAATTVISSKSVSVANPVAAFTPVTGSGGTGTLTYTISPSLPTGLSFNSSTGAISGTPTANSAATIYTVTVTDQDNETATANFALTVNGALTATTAIASQSVTYNTATSFTAVAGFGGTGPLSYSIAHALPAGLTLSASTGTITGTPSVVSSAASYIVTVTDANGATASASFTLVVNKATAAVTLKNLSQTYTGTSLSSTAITTPSGLAVSITYNGSTTAPTNAGSYAAIATVNDANYQGSASGTLTVAQAASNVTLSSNATAITPGQSLTLTATVSDATSGSIGTPTGVVTFFDGTTQIGTVTLANGTAVLNISTLAAGVPHSLSATYAGDTNFAGSSMSTPVAVGVNTLDFTFTPPSNINLTVPVGGSVSTTFSIAPMQGGYGGAVTFSAAALPVGATATFSPSSIPANTSGPQTVTMTIQVPQSSSVVSRVGRDWQPMAPIALSVLLMPLAAVRRLRRKVLLTMLCVLSLTGATALSGCAEGAAQNYPVMVSANAGSVTHRFTVNLEVKWQ